MKHTAARGGPSLVFASSRLASLLAIAPLGVWTFIHVWHNLGVFQGAEVWQQDVTGYEHPVALWATTLVVMLPLLLHTVWGIGRLASSRPNNARYGTFSNLTYLLQRVSALGVLGFLGAHLWLAFLHPRLVEHHAETFSDIAAQMRHHTPTLIVYLLGTLGVAYHLGNGVYGFAMSWGLAASRKSLRRFQQAGIVVFAVLLGMSWAVIFGLWQAGAHFPGPVASP